MVAKLKLYVDRLNPRYAAGDDKKRQMAEAFAEIVEYCRRRGGAVTSPPGRYVTIECPRGSALPGELARLGFNIVDRGFDHTYCRC